MAIRSDRAAYAPEQHPTPLGFPENPVNAQKAMPHTDRRSKLRAFVLAGSAALILAGSGGCSVLGNAYGYVKRADCLNDFMLSHRNKVFAQRAWFREEACHAGQANLGEFKAGFIKGYIDVANGGNGCCPSVAPNQYWGWKYQSPGGQAAIGAFFAGYPYGAKAAEQDGLSNWSNVRPHQLRSENPAPTTNPQAAPMVYGPDGTPVNEFIVPGSETIVPSPAEAIPSAAPTPDLEMLDIDAPIGDEASTEGVTTSLTSANVAENIPTATLDPNPAASASDVADLVPKSSSEIYTLNDREESELGEEAIEGIFGSIEIPGRVYARKPIGHGLKRRINPVALRRCQLQKRPTPMKTRFLSNSNKQFVANDSTLDNPQ